MASFSVGVVFHLVFVLKVFQNKGKLEVDMCSVSFLLSRLQKLVHLCSNDHRDPQKYTSVYSTNFKFMNNVYKYHNTKCCFTGSSKNKLIEIQSFILKCTS